MLSRAWLQLGLGWDVWVWIVLGHTVASLHGLGQSRSLPCFSLSSTYKLIYYAASGVTCILSFHQKVSFFPFFFLSWKLGSEEFKEIMRFLHKLHSFTVHGKLDASRIHLTYKQNSMWSAAKNKACGRYGI